MNLNKLSLAVAALLAGVSAAHLAHAADPIVTIDGSSTVYPITEAVAEEFQISKRNKVRVTVGISGTGGGFKKLCRGEVDISGASRPIKKSEMEACKAAGISYYEMPVAFDALTVMIHPSNKFAETMTMAELKKAWAPEAKGTVTTWKQINPAWPDTPMKLYGPGTDSGTFDYFTEAINGKGGASRPDYTASEDDNVLVQGISQDKGALGYFGFSYYWENRNKVKAVKVDGGKGPVAPSPESVENGAYAPLSRPVFIYVSAKALEKPEVKEFVEFYMANATTLVKEVKYVPLPAAIYKSNLDHVAKKKVGTVFGGESDVGTRIEDLVKREAKL
ncbi:MAG TPA: PstS family phosphate ABC transporter substrate-binding protein [Rhodocyclaceae bacterium]